MDVIVKTIFWLSTFNEWASSSRTKFLRTTCECFNPILTDGNQ